MKVARRVGIALLVGAVSGFVVGGIGGRLFMFVLAQLNPDATGVQTDDGFEMGRFTASGTINLLVVGTVLGVIGGLFFLILRGLRFGPGWFRVLSMPAGAALVVGSILVHSDGVDFTLLKPLWLAVALTLAVPFVYTLVLAGIADRWLGDESAVWGVIPVGVTWTVRIALTVLAAVALIDLVSTIDTLVQPFQFD